MTAAALIFTKLTPNPKVSVENFYTEFHENPTSSSVADMLRKDGRTDGRGVHIRRSRSARIKALFLYFVRNAMYGSTLTDQTIPPCRLLQSPFLPAVIRPDVVTAVNGSAPHFGSPNSNQKLKPQSAVHRKSSAE